MRDWVVGGAVIEARVLGGAHTGPDDAVLLVENVRRDGRSDWTTPGGVIDAGEDLVEGLTREVREETGLVVLAWSGPLYEIVAEAPDLGWRLRVEVHLAEAVDGSLQVGADPDGIVVDAQWVTPAACEDRLCDAHPWVREPLVEWMSQRFEPARRFDYTVRGTGPSDFVVQRG
jgi:8-oxo-dGTP diphosphatase